MTPYYQDDWVTMLCGDSLATLKTLPDESVQTCVTSPPYWGLRDYKMDDQLGREKTPEEYVSRLVEVFREVKRVLKDDGTLWLNLGDCFYGSWGNFGGGARGAGKQRPILKGSGAVNPAWDGQEGFRPPGTRKHETLKPKDLVGIPWRTAFALQSDGWYLRQEIIWAKPNPMPESVTDRPTRSHEQIFLFSKSPKYFYDHEAIKEPAIYFTEDGKGRAHEGDKSYPTAERNGIRKTVYKDAKDYGGKHSGFNVSHVPGRENSKRHSVRRQTAGRNDPDFDKRWGKEKREEMAICGRNKRSVWTVATRPFSEAHFAVFPPDLIKPCILAGSREGDTVLDPFSGAGTTCFVSKERKRKSIGIELNPEYIEMAARRMSQEVLL